jgi:hypothetical protein
MPSEDDKRPAAAEKDPDRDPDRTMRQRLEALIPDLVKRTLYTGLGAVMTTEEGIRRIASEFTLPKEVVGYLLTTAQATKDDLLRIVSRELREFLQNLNLGQELAKLLTQLSFEIKTEIRFIPNDQAVMGVSPSSRSKVSVKRADKGEKKDKDKDGEAEPEKK